MHTHLISMAILEFRAVCHLGSFSLQLYIRGHSGLGRPNGDQHRCSKGVDGL